MGAHSLDLLVGEKDQIKTIGDAPVVMTVYDFGGTLPQKFTFSAWDSGLGNTMFPSWAPANFANPGFGQHCEDLPIGGACRFELYVGVGDGTFHSLKLQHVVTEPAPIALLAVAIVGAVLHKGWSRRSLGEFAT